MSDDRATDENEDEQYDWIYSGLTLLIQAAVAVALVVLLWRADWENASLTAAVLVLTLVPAFMWRQYRLHLPPEFQLTAVAFIFLSLFLGSVQDFYYHYWWWDLVLHTGSGFLLGIVGFIAIYLLNRTDRLPDEVRPFFRCFFGVTFAVFLGVLWEIFEFSVDQVYPAADMQHAETGIDDTMHDLIVDTFGAIIVAAMGWAYLHYGHYSFIGESVEKVIRKNPHIFKRARRRRKRRG